MKREDSREVTASVAAAIDAIAYAMDTTRGCRLARIDPAGYVLGGTGLNLLTYGETLEGWAEPIAEQRVRIRLVASDSFPLTLVDWGRKKKIMAQLWEAIDERLAALPPTPGVIPPPPLR